MGGKSKGKGKAAAVKAAPKRARPHLEEFKGDKHNPPGVRCSKCKNVFAAGPRLDQNLAAHLEFCR
jgi:hypothetical protein